MMVTPEYREEQKEMNKLMSKIVDDMDKNSEVARVIGDPDYIYSAQFAMKHSNFVDNGDGTMSFKRPNPYIKGE